MSETTGNNPAVPANSLLLPHHIQP
jgi:hypothetical protein